MLVSCLTFYSENRKETNWESYADGKIILKWTLKIVYGAVNWVCLVQNVEQ
jgi:hypothetical protein